MNRPWDGCLREVVGQTINNRNTHQLAVLECGHTHLLSSEAMPGGRPRKNKTVAAVGTWVICGSCRDGLPPERSPRE